MPAPAIRTRLSHSRLRDLLDYNQRTGLFTWRRDKGRAKAGEVAGALQPGGQRQIAIDGRTYMANRLAWFWMTGEYPTQLLTFVDENPANNRWNNIMPASERYSQQPMAIYQRNRRAKHRRLLRSGWSNF